jgi:hypothetical protein
MVLMWPLGSMSLRRPNWLANQLRERRGGGGGAAGRGGGGVRHVVDVTVGVHVTAPPQLAGRSQLRV